MKKIFLPELNEFGYQLDVNCKLVDNEGNDVDPEIWDLFLKCWSIDTLKLLLETQIECENYEMATLINDILIIRNK